MPRCSSLFQVVSGSESRLGRTHASHPSMLIPLIHSRVFAPTNTRSHICRKCLWSPTTAFCAFPMMVCGLMRHVDAEISDSYLCQDEYISASAWTRISRDMPMLSCRQVQQKHRYGSQHRGLLLGLYDLWCEELLWYLLLARLLIFSHSRNCKRDCVKPCRSTRRGRVTCSPVTTACSTCWCLWGWVIVLNAREITFSGWSQYAVQFLTKSNICVNS